MRVTKTISIDQLGLEFQLLPQHIADAVDMELYLPRVLDFAKAWCPVSSGALRDSIRVERPNPRDAKLMAGGLDYLNPDTGKPIDYARFVHDGTSKMAPRPFLLQALIAEKHNIAKGIIDKTVSMI